MKKLPLRLENIGPRSASDGNIVDLASSEEQQAQQVDQPGPRNFGPWAWPPPVSEAEIFQRLIEASEAQTHAIQAYMLQRKEAKPAARTHQHVLKAYYCNSSYNTTVVIAALIITCCFAGILQPPGGTQSAGNGPNRTGAANLGSRASFKVFFVTNGLAMVTASFAIFLLMTGHPITEGGAEFLLFLGRMLMGIAVHFTLVAFFSAAFIVTGEASVLVPVVVLCGVLFVFYYSLYTCEGLGCRRPQSKQEAAEEASKQQSRAVETAAPLPVLDQSRSTRLSALGMTSWATPRTFGRSFDRRSSEGSEGSSVQLNVASDRI